MLPQGHNLRAATRAIREHPFRSLLTTLGIVMGVGSVVLLVAIGQGVKEDVERQIDSLGTNLVIIVPGMLDSSGQPDIMSTLGISTLTRQDVAKLAALPGVKLSVPLMFVFGSVQSETGFHSALVLGTTPSMMDIRAHPMAEGRFLNNSDSGQRVCVLAAQPRNQIYGSAPALGRTLKVRGIPFKVVGVLAPEEPSLFAGSSFANVALIPISAATSAFKAGQINRILLKTDSNVPPGHLLGSIRTTLLADHHQMEDFGMLTQKQLLAAIYKLSAIVTALLGGISAISLVVAGIGIMNIMLVTVTERTREIGIRKTVGARNSDIFQQFLTEAVTLSVAGGITGIALAAAICRIAGNSSALKPHITGSALAMAFSVCFAVGVLFGVVPALRAARQDPIQALRWE